MTIFLLQQNRRFILITNAIVCCFILFSLTGCSNPVSRSATSDAKQQIPLSESEQFASEPQGSEANSPEKDNLNEINSKELVQCFYHTLKEDSDNINNQNTKHIDSFLADKYFSFLIHYDSSKAPNSVQSNNRQEMSDAYKTEQSWGTLWRDIIANFDYNNHYSPLPEISVFDLSEKGLIYPPIKPNVEYSRELEKQEVSEISSYFQEIYEILDRVYVEEHIPWCIVEISDDTFILLASAPSVKSTEESPHSSGSSYIFKKSPDSHYLLSDIINFSPIYW